MHMVRRHLERAPAAIAAAAVLLITVSVAGAVPKMGARSRAETASALPGMPRVELSADPGEVVILLRESAGEIASEDRPWMKVHADGTVERHLPPYMRNAGDWTGRIGPAELQSLAQSVAGAGVVEFDPLAVRSERREILSRGGALSYVSDTSLIEIEVRFAEYQRPGSLTVRRNVRKVAAWDGLRNDARRFPQIESLQGMRTAFAMLSDLADRIVATGTRKEESR